MIQGKFFRYIPNNLRFISSCKVRIFIFIWISISTVIYRYFSAKHIIYVLIWNNTDVAPFYYLIAKDVLINSDCKYTNCYITDDKEYFGGDLSQFHAIAFNGRVLHDLNVSTVPRSPHQKFIYYNSESHDTAPIKNHNYDNFFNWTATCRLDSDIPYTYILIKDSSNKTVGPRIDMKWEANMTDVDEAPIVSILHKSRAAVTFVSHCQTKNKREYHIKKLREELTILGYSLDVFGMCGKRKCGKGSPMCDRMVQRYYFYLPYENTFSKDYVTEKVLRALNNYAVPIVFGGANYSRFLPPGSYLNARDFKVRELANTMVELIQNPDRYLQFFKWQRHYTFHDPQSRENVCALCEALNNRTKYETVSIYTDIKAWWESNKG